MPISTQYFKVKDKEIPISIRNYKNSKSVKMYFKGNVLNVTKPKRLPMNNLIKILKENEEDIYSEYLKILSSEIQSIKQWKTGEKIYYKGIELEVIREYKNIDTVSVKIEIKQKQFKVMLPESIQEYEIKEYVDFAIKKLLKINTESMIKEKLPYWSKVTGIEYNSVKVRDAISRYGSCMPLKKNVYFSSRLIMLPEEAVDAIIVHELCHMRYKNHNKEFYNLVEKYIPNYKEIDKWLKDNGKIIMF